MKKILVATLIVINIVTFLFLFCWSYMISSKLDTVDETQNRVIRSLNALIEDSNTEASMGEKTLSSYKCGSGVQ